jgi:murein tripeptide amidase MpaA
VLSINAQTNWSTEFEKSKYVSTSNYKETMLYFEKLAEHSEFAMLNTFGISPQGRELKYMIISKDKIFDHAEAKRSDKAVILINNGIHSGEIEGKDASMLMLREMLITKESEHLLENVILLIIPIFNVDGHERSSSFNRINQNGPAEMGWRTTAQNLNLNRDFVKADAPEMKAFLKLFMNWLPDIFIDIHTTDGADYQYTITYDISRYPDVPPYTRHLVINEIIPQIETDVYDSGYLISPFVGFVDGDYNNGIKDWIASPRFSNGYAAAQNRIGLLVETHMLKPYKDRVFSTKVLMESVIRFSSFNHSKLKEAAERADNYVIDWYSSTKKAVPVKFDFIYGGINFNFKGFERFEKPSIITGNSIHLYSDKPVEKLVPYYNKPVVTDSVFLPKAYYIPKEWSGLLDIISIHGIEYSRIEEQFPIKVERIKFKDVKLSNKSYEGRQIPDFEYLSFQDSITAEAGDYLVFTDQRNAVLIANLFEPKSNDSFVKWGFMNIIFERKEYFEDYSMEPIAHKMYSENKLLREEFNEKLISDSAFAANSWQRLNFFYERSPYYDIKHNIYPILKVLKKIDF